MTEEGYFAMDARKRGDYHEMPLGSFYIFTNQPQKNNILSLFEKQVYPHRLLPNGEAEVPYDVAGWTLPLQMGVEADAVWATRGRWTLLAGAIGSQPITIAMIDHPQNPGFPTYWHARGYGLFAANPLGQKIFSEGRETMNFTLQPGASATFRYRVVVLEEKAPATRIQREFDAFSGGR